MQQNNINNCLVSAIIWLGAPFFFFILMPLLSGKFGFVANFTNFILPGLSIFVTAFFISGFDIIKDLFSLFSKNKPVDIAESTTPVPASYGRGGIPISLFAFSVGGFLVGLVNGAISNTVMVYAAVGAVWGLAVYMMFQKRVFDPDDF